MRWQALLFDLDGTLIRSVELYAMALQHACSKVDFSLTNERFWQIYWGNAHLPELLASANLSTHEEEVRSARDNKYTDLLRKKIVWYPDAEPCLKALPSDIPKAVITGSWQSYVDAIEERLPLSQYFQCIVTADNTRPYGKPHPHGLLMTADRLGVEPEQCIYIGDQGFDVQAANAADMTSCLIQRDVTGQGAEKDADIVITSLEQLLGHIS
jgi:phosphoglycolate phosphatase